MEHATSIDRPPLDAEVPEQVETATFGLGCFWGPDARFGILPGVVRTRVGYAGGTKEAPTYRDLGDHTEVLQVEYDPEQLRYEDLLRLFWKSHNPTRAPWKRQYRSVLLVADETQQEQARASKEQAAEVFGAPIETAIEPLDRFYRAEDYHQKYRLRHDETLMREFEKMLGTGDAFTDSTAAARANGYVAGHGTPKQLDREIDRLGLSDTAKRHLRTLMR